MNTMRLPDFLIIGGMKCGTTALDHHLRRHPRLFVDGEECEFFVAEKTWSRGVEWYASRFEEAGRHQLIGEDSTSYTKLPLFQGVPGRVKATIPDVKLLYLVRHPIDRMRSHWLHQRWAGDVRLTAEQALGGNDDYLHCSSYAMQLRAWLEHFPREQVHVVVSEELRSDAPRVVGEVCEFLGVDPAEMPPPDAEARIHASENKWMPRHRMDALYAAATGPRTPARLRGPLQRLLGRPGTKDAAAISPALERRLVERLQPDLRDLRELLGGDFPAWGLLDSEKLAR